MGMSDALFWSSALQSLESVLPFLSSPCQCVQEMSPAFEGEAREIPCHRVSAKQHSISAAWMLSSPFSCSKQRLCFAERIFLCPMCHLPLRVQFVSEVCRTLPGAGFVTGVQRPPVLIGDVAVLQWLNEVILIVLLKSVTLRLIR